LVKDHLQHTIHVSKGCISSKSQNGKALRLKEFITPGVIKAPVGMLRSIQLHDQPGLQASKVGDVWTLGVLTPELHAQLLATQLGP
jgi:hypothetical protein